MDLTSQFTTARKRGVPLLGIVTADPSATVSWIHLLVHSDQPIVQWDSARGLLGVNDAGMNSLVRVTGVDDGEDLKNLTMDSVNALGIAEKLPGYAVAIFLNLPSHWHHPEVAQAVWNLRDPFKSNLRTLVILAPDITPPAVLHHDLVVWEEPLPSDADITKITHELYEAAGFAEPDASTDKRVCETVRGLPAFAAEQAIALSINGKGIKFDVLWHHKKRMIENTPGLTVYSGGETFNDLAGLGQIKKLMQGLFSGLQPPKAIIYVEEIEKMFAGASSDHAGDGGVAKDSLQNILTEMENNDWSGLISVGPPGSGKSLLSKAIGATYDVPTIAFDLGATRTSLVGASEQAVRACFRVIKAIAGNGAFWVATCNKYETLPPELKRRFRYGIWYTGLPDDNELTSIWDIQRLRYKIDPGDRRPTGVRYSGADVRNICEIASRLQIKLIEAASYIVPVSVSDPQSINKLEEAAHGRFLSASYPGVHNKDGATKATAPTALKTGKVRAMGHLGD
jgi:hypothetical protein